MIETALYLQAALWLIVVIMYWWSGRANLFHPVLYYLIFHGLAFVLRPFLVYYANFDAVWRYMEFEPTEAQFLRSLAIGSVGLVVFVATCLYGGRRARKLDFTVTNTQFSDSENVALFTVIIGLLPMILYSLYVMATETNEMGLPEGEYIDGFYIMTGASGYAYEAQTMLVPLLALLLLRYRFNIFAFIPVIGYLGYRMFIGWGRWTIILSSLGFLLTYCWWKRRTRPPMYVFAGLLILIPLFSIIGHNRTLVRDLLSGQSLDSRMLDSSVAWQEKYDVQDYASFDFVAFLAATVPEKTKTYNYGVDWLGLFTSPIPRSVWKSKPAGSPSFFKLNDYGNFTQLTFSLPGGGWIEGGWVGVIILCSIWGYGLGRLYRWFTWNSHSKAVTVTYVMLISVIIQLYRDGNISIFRFWFFIVTPMLLWIAVVRLIKPKKKIRRAGLAELAPNKPVVLP